jgi:hypothetical protein
MIQLRRKRKMNSFLVFFRLPILRIKETIDRRKRLERYGKLLNIPAREECENIDCVSVIDWVYSR